MIRFESDYLEGAVPEIMSRLIETNYEQTAGYGTDPYCRAAREKIKLECNAFDADIHFLVGGTQANLTVIAAALRPHQGVMAAETAHIEAHETGAIEATGHKVITLPTTDGKINAADVKNYGLRHRADESFEHIVQPAMVYISQPTETGTVYSLPELEELSSVCRELGLETPEPDLTEWRAMVERMHSQSRSVKIGLVGKYVKLHDAYLSVAEALRHAAWAQDAKVDIDWIDAEELEKPDGERLLSGLDGIIVPGGFGLRGTEGMFIAARYAREHHVPYFGICLGMQTAVIEFARDAAGLADANSGEFDPESTNKVIDFMPGQSESVDKGGTLRLGGYPCVITPGTTMARCYGEREITERHRHRYEFNNDYRELLQEKGLTLSGLSPDGRLVEAVELSGERFFVGVQYHPEFKSRPNRPHPLFMAFIAASLGD